MALQNANEFKTWMRWHDYFSIIIHEFPIILFRKYDWMDKESSTFMVQVLGFKIYQRVWEWQ